MKVLTKALPVFLVVLLFFACTTSKNKPITQRTMNENSIKLPPDEFAKEWHEIDSLLKKRLPKSALAKLKELEPKIRQSGHPGQLIKWVNTKVRIMEVIEPESDWKNYKRYKQEITKASPPARQLLHFYLGKYLATWLDQNAWRIRNRTALDESVDEDLRTWSRKRFEEEIVAQFEKALAGDVLKNYSAKMAAPYLHEGKNTKGLRPTLYDLVAHEVLDFFMDEANFLTEPAYRFVLDNPVYFADASTFAQAPVQAKDTVSRKYLALKLFQSLTSLHLNDASPDALVDLELKRLKFVYRNYAGDNKDALYLNALSRLREKYADSPLAAEVIVAMAQFYRDKAQTYVPGGADTTYRYANQKAVDLLEEAIRLYPKTHGAGMAAMDLAGIRRKVLRIQIEETYLPDTWGLMRIDYTNVTDAEVMIFRLKDPQRLFTTHDDLEWDKMESISKKKYTLKDFKDYRNHSVEVGIPPLTFGQYVVLVREAGSEKPEPAWAVFQVTRLTVQPGNRPKEKQQLFRVLQRDSGRPEGDVKLTVLQQERYKRKQKKLEVVTDARGMAKLSIPNDFGYWYGMLEKGADRFFFRGSRGYYGYDGRHTPQKQVSLFLDRAIYRPGQRVWFKAILLERDKDNLPHIKPHENLEVSLRNAHGKEVKKLQLKTTEFGSVSGHFDLPKGGLRGMFSLRTKYGSQSFRVEEYKRPRFEVKMMPPERDYALGDKVTVKGEAKNYAGAPLDGAQVKYTVLRQTEWPYFFYRRSYWNPWMGNNETQIATGTATVRPDGSFEVEFEALPDREVDKSTRPVFTYLVKVSVTDITGETHEADSRVRLGYVSLLVDVPVPKEDFVENFHSIKISSTNLNGKKARAQGHIKMERLQIPEKYFIKRYWERPEYQMMSRKEFAERLPLFAYEGEDEPENMKVGSTVLDTKFDTGQADSIAVPKDLHQGYYKLTLETSDKNGSPITVVKYLKLKSLQSRAYVFNDLFDVNPVNTTVEPGDVAKLLVGSRGQVRYWLTTSRYDRMPVDESEQVDRSQRKVNFAVTEKDRGGFRVDVFAVRHNRSFMKAFRFNVPWPNKKLQLSFETFRDKLLPGQKEKWRIKVSGPNKDAAAAEVVAAMYDASLDAFAKNRWPQGFYPSRYFPALWRGYYGFQAKENQTIHTERIPAVLPKIYDRLQVPFRYFGYRAMEVEAQLSEVTVMSKKADGVPASPVPDSSESINAERDKADESEVEKTAEPTVTPRTNLAETVFFMPALHTDADGNVILEFTMNEALTRWRLMTFAHDKQYRYGYAEKTVVTQKELMVIPNPPRFLREFDEVEFSAKVVNLSDRDLRPNVELQLLDEAHTVPVYKWLDNPQFNKVVNLPKGRSVPVAFRFKVPSAGEVPLIKWTLIAAAAKHSDGESDYLPVLTNRILVTETMTLPVKPNEEKVFDFKAMKKAKTSTTLEEHALTLEFTSNPAWYAVQSLPYLMEYPHECSEQVFNRFYANTLASSVANAHPKIKRVFDQWREAGSDALLSNLSKNQALKSALLEETPWLNAALGEEEQKKNIALLFDLDRMAGEQEAALEKLAKKQTPTGGFAWFEGGRPNWYITQYIVEGVGHLRKLNALNEKEHPRAFTMTRRAIGFIDRKLQEHYQELLKAVNAGKAKWEDDHLDNMVIHYLYARSFFPDIRLPDHMRKIKAYYVGQAKKYHLNKGLYQEALIALALHREGETGTARNIMKSIKERAVEDEELGMYWKNVSYGYFWYQLPIETHALMIEAFDEVSGDADAVYQLKLWLLKNKQTNHWKTTKATAAAVYAFLKTGKDWLASDRQVEIRLGDQVIDQGDTEAGTGYFKISWDKERMPAGASKITVKNPNSTIAWGGIYWQYFEDLDKVKIFKDTPLSLEKQLYKITSSDRGPVLTRVNEGDVLHVGDRVKVRIVLRSDRAMEYVHMKDMRAAGFEPVNVLSRYKWQDGLGYYESTRDLATDFFFSYLRPGVYVFEYEMTVQLRGDFSNGITTIQCMYAPEFSSHSEGIRVKVE